MQKVKKRVIPVDFCVSIFRVHMCLCTFIFMCPYDIIGVFIMSLSLDNDEKNTKFELSHLPEMLMANQ